jgi:hypothetical protein
MMRFVALLAMVAAIGGLVFAINDLTRSVNAENAARQEQQDAEKAVTEKTRKIMEYDPSKARLVAP